MRKTQAGADPDAQTRVVTLPADWEDAAASALVALAPGAGGVSLTIAALAWIGPLAEHPRADPTLGQRLTRLLVSRAAAPNRVVWQGRGRGRGEPPAFVVNLAAFVEPGGDFDQDGFAACIATVTEALHLLDEPHRRILLGNLDACLAGLGLDYDSDAARGVAACLAALATGWAHPGLVAPHGAGKTPPPRCAVPGLGNSAVGVWQSACEAAGACKAGANPSPGLFADVSTIETGLSAPGPVDALLGFEACGISPIFSPLRADGRLAASTHARLAARAMSPEAALAASLAGENVLRKVGYEATQAMQRAVSPFIDQPPVLVPPVLVPPVSMGPILAPTRPITASSSARRELPSRHGGFTQKASVGGHRLFLRTGEYADGSLGELSITAGRDGPVQRGLLEAFSQAVSLGLQHGVPLAAYVEAFAYTQFGPSGPVEGDACVSSATSVLDYAFRSLAHAYLAKAYRDPDVAPDGVADDEALLPLDLPRASNPASRPAIRQRHGLRLVG